MPDSSLPAAFISYCRDDSEFALRLARDLKSAGARIWMDQLDIPGGRHWDTAVQDALIAADRTLVILSPHSARSDNVLNEISFALEQGKTVIPVIYRDCTVPLQLQRNNRIDFRADYTRGLAALLDNLQIPHPDPAVLDAAAQAEALRKAAWQARESEALRLQQLAHPTAEAPSAPDNATPTHSYRPTARMFVLAGVFFGALVLAIVLHLHKPSPAAAPIVEMPQPTRAPAAASIVPATDPEPPPAKPPTPQPTTKPSPPPPVVAAATKPDKSAADSAERQGHAYEVGEGVAVDYARAKDLYTRACAAANAEACGRLGFMYYRATGVSEDYAGAREYFTRACAGGYAHGCYGLGKIYDDGSGVPVDYGKAAQFYKKGCDGGDGNGCGELGYLYMTGLGVPQDWDRARPLLKKGCDLGSKVGCVQLDNVDRAADSKAHSPAPK